LTRKGLNFYSNKQNDFSKFIVESPARTLTWTEFSDRPENPNYNGDEGDSLYEDSLDSCDSEVASLDDADLCPPRVHGWAEGTFTFVAIFLALEFNFIYYITDTARRTLLGNFERLPPNEPKHATKSKKI
jgi:hypothetical protein